jgi:metal-responsive CopG/Arc/MetJ family transcriptional regulator
MKQLLLEIEEDLAAKLKAVAPGGSRKRSEFVRNAIRKALWDLEEALTAEAYERRPDAAEVAYFDPRIWERIEPTRRSRLPKK